MVAVAAAALRCCGSSGRLVRARGLLARPVRLRPPEQGRGEGRKDLRLRPLQSPQCLMPLGTLQCCGHLPVHQWSQVWEKPMALHAPS